MLLSSRVRVPFPRSLVYTTHRDHLADFVADLEGVRAIKVISRIEERGQVHLVNEWLGGGEIPAIARAFVNENMLSWTDFAIWNNKDFTTDWTIQTHAFTQAVHCSGTHRFLEDGNSTVIESEGILTIDPHQIKEVPRFLAGMIAGIVEDVLRQKIDSSLKHVAKGVHHYLEQHCYR